MNQNHEIFSDVFAVYSFLTKEKGGRRFVLGWEL